MKYPKPTLFEPTPEETQEACKRLVKESMKGTCKHCGCTLNNPCYHPDFGTCWWEDESETECSHCVNPEIQNKPGVEHRINSKK